MNNKNPTLQDIFCLASEAYFKQYPVPGDIAKVIAAIKNCKTPLMGSYVKQCLECGYTVILDKSCRNRHCPNCQQIVKAGWLLARKSELLPVEYYHTVFTIPHGLNSLIMQNKKILYGLLFRCVWETIKQMCNNPEFRMQGMPGYTSILHTWDSQLNYHVHLHLVIPGGVLTEDGFLKSREGFFLPVKAMAKLFRGKYISEIKKLFALNKLVLSGNLQKISNKKAFCGFLKPLYNDNWIVYSKEPFNGADTALEYIGRYTHRVAISNSRIKKLKDGQVTFEYRDRKDNNEVKPLQISAVEFMHRFLMHVLPLYFTRIRHYGFLANKHKKAALNSIRTSLSAESPKAHEKLSTAALMLAITGKDIDLCSECKKGKLIIINYNYTRKPENKVFALISANDTS